MRSRVTSLLSSDDDLDDDEDESSSGSLFGDSDSNRPNNRRPKTTSEFAHIKKQMDGFIKDVHTMKNEMAEMNKRINDCSKRKKFDGKLKTRCINCGSKAALLFLDNPFCKQSCVNHMW